MAPDQHPASNAPALPDWVGGHSFTGRPNPWTPYTNNQVADLYGPDTWLSADGDNDRGDRYSHKPLKPRKKVIT